MDLDAEIALIQSDPRDARATMDALWHFEAGCRTVWCRDGLEGLEYVFGTGWHWGRPDGRLRLVLLDTRLGVLDGFEVLRRLRAGPLGDSLCVVMLTDRVPRRPVVGQPRVDRWVRKPPTVKTIANVLRVAGIGAIPAEV